MAGNGDRTLGDQDVRGRRLEQRYEVLVLVELLDVGDGTVALEKRVELVDGQLK